MAEAKTAEAGARARSPGRRFAERLGAGRWLVASVGALLALLYVVGVLGGCLVSATRLQITPSIYLQEVVDSLSQTTTYLGVPKDLYTGLIKAHVFGIIIASVGCSVGLRATRGAIGVGRATRLSVIVSFLLIIVIGYYMTSLFYS